MGHARASLVRWLRPLMKPVVTFALKNSLHIQDLEEALKGCLLEVAKEQLERAGHGANVSKLSVATGMHRREVNRLLENTEPAPEPKGLCSRVVGQWQLDARFCQEPGRPRPLKLGDEVKELITSVSSDVNHATVYSELLRTGAVTERSGKAFLRRRAYATRHDIDESYGLLTKDMADLVHSVDANLDAREAVHLHARTEFDNIRADKLPEIRKWVLREGSAFHRRVREFLSQFDLDIKPAKRETPGGCRVSVSAFSFSEDPEDESK